MSSQSEPTRSMKLQSPVIPIAVTLLFGVQMLFPSKAWMILLTGLGGAWLLSFAWARSLRRGLVLEREMRFGWMQVGDRLQERITIENNGWAPGLWIKVDDQSDMQDYQISTVTDIRSWKYRFWYSRGICSRRGLFTLGPTSLETGDPLGIYRVVVEYPLTANMMVAPQVISLPEIEIAAGGRIGEGKSSVRGFEHTVTAGGVREYMPGDSLRWIHWPTTARREAPFVHQFDNEPASDWWVVLDMDPAVHLGEGDRSTEEYGVILAASLVNRGLQEGKAVGLISQGRELLWHSPDTGDVQLWKILRSLAPLRPGGPPLEELLERLRSSLGQRVSMVIITSNLSTTWLKSVELLQRSGIVPTVILIDPVSFGGFGNIQGVRERLVRLGITHYTITADLLEPEEEQEEDPWGWLFVPASRQNLPRKTRGDRFRESLRTVRNWALVSLTFLGMANAIAGTVQGIETGFLWYLILSGMIFGGILSATSLPGWISGLLSGLAGVIVTTVRVGRFENQILNVLTQSFQFISQGVLHLFTDAKPADGTLLGNLIRQMGEEIAILGSRFWGWGRSGLGGEPYFDPVATVMVWGIILWVAVNWMMWMVTRRGKPVLAGVPSLGIVGISLTYFNQTSYDLVLMLGALITLGVLVHYDSRERQWERSQLYFDKTIRPKVLFTGLGLAFGLMVLSIVSPSISVRSISDFIQDLGEPRRADLSIARSIGLQPSVQTRELNLLEWENLGQLPNSHLIGSAPDLSDQVVMTVNLRGFADLEEVQPVVEVEGGQYVRNLTYDRYTGNGWISRDTDLIEYPASDYIYPAWLDNHRLLRQELAVENEIRGLLYAIGSPLTVDRDLSLAWRIKNDEQAIYDYFGGTIEASTYQVDAFIPVFSEDGLRNAGQVYPDWLRSRYMSLPSSVPDRVLTLARDITATELTPYDRAVALEGYLRKFPYTLEVSQPPVGADLVEFFLFTLQEGYCDYYASSMAVLARAAGLPARLATGYIAEDYDPVSQAFVVTADQAHAWVEIYFPGYGWIPFEPTGGRAAIDRPTEAPTLTVEKFDLPERSTHSSGAGLLDRLPGYLGLAIAAGLGGLIFWQLFQEIRLQFLSQEKVIPHIFNRLYRYGPRLGTPPQPSHTAFEYSDQLKGRLYHLGQTSLFSTWLLEGVKDLEIITEAYLKLLFSPAVELPEDPGQPRASYRRLRVRLWVLWALSRAYKIPVTWNVLWKTYPVSRSSTQVSEG